MSTPKSGDLADSEEAVTQVAIALLNPGDSPRLDGENIEHVRLLAESGNELPPILVHRPTMRVIDGMHRLQASQLRGDTTINVRFFHGEDRDAFVLAVRSNVTHGLPLSLGERTAAARRIIVSHPHWSDRAIASISGIAPNTVASLRRRVARDTPGGTTIAGRIGLDGRVRPLDRERRRQHAEELMRANPHSTLREIARRADISLGTAQDVRRRLGRRENPELGNPHRTTTLSEETGSEHRPAVPEPRTRSDSVESAPAANDPHREDILDSLRSDPSLRFTEAGRSLLRLLQLHALTAEQWDQMVNKLPAHCTELVATMAAECANTWSEFSERVRRRGPMSA
ncbi:ParB/RepB/Spo0J family partition protein [Amycolatopsis pigmentata]|uniref:ParB N-terminal domain-containing protein n=1 Tax=Amycolatopsis pigmentata TaxID=450801 RepID=A0ABW5FZT7_9PSEU